ncbi:hypothetical protein [Streptomyces sp. AM 2-1-1]|uniref:hypothetical protein n=1 Tax=Streptomyces sp. AM 2-1-1 TaxID=3028709 RepID=UPI0023B9B97F|nr:hypothetical protein [Streptomyces sp. AM 2-1-1]WEH40663.1 hypothetical protein PZB77_14785 [Streptomyces sp. AM 2-1-1]
MRILEGTPAEIAEFLRLTDQAAEGDVAETADVLAASGGMDEASVQAFIDQRGRTDAGKARVRKYFEKLGRTGVEIVTGQSARTKDGHTDYLMVRDDGPRRFGAVAYVKPANSGLTLRLTREDVADVDPDHIQFRDVRAGHQYVVNCPLTSDEAIDWAVELTLRALAKVRTA